MKKEANLIIIGGGAAGMMAAIGAAEAGEKKIIILEKVDRLGGSGAVAAALGALGGPALERRGIKINKDEVFKKFMKWCHWKADARLVRTWINNSGDIIQWLEDRDVIFEEVTAVNAFDGESRIAHLWPNRESLTVGPVVSRAIIKQVKEYEIPCYLNTIVKRIIIKEDRVAGVLAEIDGEEVTIGARSVMIATGNFGKNKELVSKYWPEYDGEDIYSHCLPQMTGDGIYLAEEAGARIQDQVVFWSFGPHHVAPGWIFNLTFMLRWPETIWVNIYGERYADESLFEQHHCMASNPLNLQPGKICYAIFDSYVYERILEGSAFGPEYPIAYDKNGKKFHSPSRGDLEKEIKKGTSFTGNTWEELAGKLSIDPAVLRETADTYNSFCEHGYDRDFCKDQKYLTPLLKPPFYAVTGKQGFDMPMGGININHRMEVLSRKNRSPIPGLYSAGDIAWGGTGITGCVHVWPPLNMALTCGHLAGKNIAEYLNSWNG